MAHGEGLQGEDARPGRTVSGKDAGDGGMSGGIFGGDRRVVEEKAAEVDCYCSGTRGDMRLAASVEGVTGPSRSHQQHAHHHHHFEAARGTPLPPAAAAPPCATACAAACGLECRQQRMEVAPTRHAARSSLLSALRLLPRTLSPGPPSPASPAVPSPLLAPPAHPTHPSALAAPECVVGRGSNGSCSGDCCVADTCAAGSLADLASEEGERDRSYAEDCRVFTWEKPHKMHNVMATVWDEFTVAHAVGWCAKALIIRDRRMLLLLSIAFELTECMYRHLLPNFNECWWDSLILDIMLCNTLGMEVGLWLLQACHMPRFDWFAGVSSLIAHTAPSLAHLVSTTRQSLVAALLFLLVLAADLCAFFLKHCLALPPLHPFNTLRLCLWAALSLPAAHCLHSLLHSPLLACPCPSASGAGRAGGRTAGENGAGRGEGEHPRKADG
ncbi:unnamed protein product [Closterium sp. NIES-65]|nr:unnamed protein product [Closterium sp. NIES-65]